MAVRWTAPSLGGILLDAGGEGGAGTLRADQLPGLPPETTVVRAAIVWQRAGGDLPVSEIDMELGRPPAPRLSVRTSLFACNQHSASQPDPCALAANFAVTVVARS